MKDLLTIRCDPLNVEGLHDEIVRRDKVIRSLMKQIERRMDSVDNDFALLQNTFVLEEQVRCRTDELKRSVEELEAFMAHAPVGILVTCNHKIFRQNQKFSEIFGFSGDDAIGQPTRRLFCFDAEYECVQHLSTPLLSASQTFRTELYMRRQDGADLWINLIGYSLQSEHPDQRNIWMLEDRTVFKLAEESLRRSHKELEARTRELHKREAELSAVIENAYDAYVCINESGVVTEWNHQAQETFGWSAKEAIGRMLDELIIPPDMQTAHRAGIRRYLETKQTRVIERRMELPAIRRDGSSLTVEVRSRALEFGGHAVFSAFLHDITQRKELEALREREARYDLLTGLPNRRGLTEILPVAMARADRSGCALGVLFLDLDGFKAVNDTYGHETGDFLLHELAERLQRTVRQTDTVARLAGDEFTVILEGLKSGAEEACVFAQRIIEAVSCPFALGAHTVHVGVSIGVAIYPSHHPQSSVELIRQADAAMYEAKRTGKGQVRVVSNEGAINDSWLGLNGQSVSSNSPLKRSDIDE